jgi:hypothetical protein
MNYFIKGLQSAPDVAEKVVEKFPTDYQDLKDKTIMVVKARQLIRAMRNTGAPPFQRPTQPPNLRPNQPRYNSSNAPKAWNNVPVPMDLSRGRFSSNRNNQRFTRGNTTQVEEPQRWGPRPQRIRKCYNCDKPGHFAAECHQPKRTQARQAYVQDYMDQEEDLSEIQEAINPTNLLNNTLKVFDTLPLEQKDALIAKYEGKKEDFAAA